MSNVDIVEKARQYAISKHRGTNHLYDGIHYDFHLQMVVDQARRFDYLLPEPGEYKVIMAACWLHDTIEDCRVTYNDIQKEFGSRIAEIVYALTNDKGRTRKERAGENYYKFIWETPGAKFVKICDRLANVKYSFSQQSSMFEVYKREHEDFKRHLTWRGDGPGYKDMWAAFDELFHTKEVTVNV